MTTLNPAERCSVANCGRRKIARGWCPTHYRRWKLGLDMNQPVKTPGGPLIDRVMARVDLADPEDCWRWVGRQSANGYGQLWDEGKTVLAHRATYELLVGPIPEGLQLDHLCRVRDCVNPDHLEPVTSRENTTRGFGACGVNARKAECANGHPYTPKNTYTYPSGHRRCRTCSQIQSRERTVRRRKGSAK